MANLNSFINVSIKRNTSFPSQIGFGVPLILSADPHLRAWSSWGATRVRTYNTLESVEADFPIDANVYKMAAAMFAQNPSPPEIKIGRRSTGLVVQTVTFQVNAGLADDTVVGLEIDGTEYSTTKSPGDAPSTTASSLQTVVDAAPTVGATVLGDTVTITAVVPGYNFVCGRPTGGILTDTTTGAGLGDNLVTDFNSIVNQDNDFYCVHLDATSATEIEALSDHIENLSSSNPKIFIYRTFDNAVKVDPDTTSIMYTLNQSKNLRSFGIYTESGDFIDCAIAGLALPQPAGSINWAWKQLSGVSPDQLTDNEQNVIKNKNGNYYISLAGLNLFFWGKGHYPEWIDTVRGSDWLAARVKERVATLLANTAKVPFTDDGIAQIVAEIYSQGEQAISRGFLAKDPAFTVTYPFAKDIPAADKQARHLKSVTFRGTIAGAVNLVTLVGELDL